MTTSSIRFLSRCLAAAGVAALAACQHAAPTRASAQPPAGAPAAAAQAAPGQPGRPAQPAQSAQPGQQGASRSAPTLTFHLAQARPAAGLAQVQLNPDTALYAVPRPVFTQADLQQVVPMQNKNGQVYLRFDFTQQGAAKLAQLTRQAVGNYLIISVRGKPVAVPQIASAYEEGQFPVAVDGVEDAQAIVRLLRQPAK